MPVLSSTTYPLALPSLYTTIGMVSAEVGSAEVWLRNCMFSPPLIPSTRVLLEQIKMLLVRQAVHLLVVAVIIGVSK